MITVGLLALYLGRNGQDRGEEPQFRMVTAMSLRMAYRRGGMAELEEQCDRAAAMFGPGSVSIADVYDDLNG